MEVLCKVIAQGAMETREWTRPSDGQVINIKSVALKLKSGADVIICEATDSIADFCNAHPLIGKLCQASLRFIVTKGKEDREFMRCRLIDICEV